MQAISGTGPNRRIVRADVLEFAASGGQRAAAPSPSSWPAAATAGAAFDGAYVDIPNSNIRKITAQRLTDAKRSIPHYYLSVDINLDHVLSIRKELNDRLEKESGGGKGTTNAKAAVDKVSVNDFVVKACALACMHIPTVNSSWMETFIRQYKYADISVAVQTDNGLITPIVQDAHAKGLLAISRETKELAAKARNNKLKPQEFMGGTFTVSNLGMYGISHFAAIINPPQSAILAVGAAVPRVIPNPSKPGDFTTGTFMSVTLSCDHRVIDGAVGAEYLKYLKSLLEEPHNMLL